jgi:hypothetical protein
MRNANRPAGPGTLTRERRDSTTQQEEMEELADTNGKAEEPARDPTRSARQADRGAHVKGQNRSSGNSRDRLR